VVVKAGGREGRPRLATNVQSALTSAGRGSSRSGAALLTGDELGRTFGANVRRSDFGANVRLLDFGFTSIPGNLGREFAAWMSRLSHSRVEEHFCNSQITVIDMS